MEYTKTTNSISKLARHQVIELRTTWIPRYQGISLLARNKKKS